MSLLGHCIKNALLSQVREHLGHRLHSLKASNYTAGAEESMSLQSFHEAIVFSRNDNTTKHINGAKKFFCIFVMSKKNYLLLAPARRQILFVVIVVFVVVVVVIVIVVVVIMGLHVSALRCI
jgi:hypothetical protein